MAYAQTDVARRQLEVCLKEERRRAERAADDRSGLWKFEAESRRPQYCEAMAPPAPRTEARDEDIL